MAICYFIVSLSIKAKYCTYQVTLDVSLHCGYPKHCWHIASGWEFGKWDGMHRLFMYLPFDIWTAGVKTLWSWDNKEERILCWFQWMFGTYHRHKNRKGKLTRLGKSRRFEGWKDFGFDLGNFKKPLALILHLESCIKFRCLFTISMLFNWFVRSLILCIAIMLKTIITRKMETTSTRVPNLFPMGHSSSSANLDVGVCKHEGSCCNFQHFFFFYWSAEGKIKMFASTRDLIVVFCSWQSQVFPYQPHLKVFLIASSPKQLAADCNIFCFWQIMCGL